MGGIRKEVSGNKINIKDLGDLKADKLSTSTGQAIEIDRQKTGFGYKKFFICPTCGERRADLYIWRNTFRCRSCYPGNVYAGIQNVPHGGYRYIEYMMKQVAKSERQPLRIPYHFQEWILSPKPKYMRWQKWYDGQKKLQVLENMRFQSIFFKTKYPGFVIDKVLANIDKVNISMKNLDEYFYDWHAIAYKMS